VIMKAVMDGRIPHLLRRIHRAWKSRIDYTQLKARASQSAKA
jgi:hypothetical protein